MFHLCETFVDFVFKKTNSDSIAFPISFDVCNAIFHVSIQLSNYS